MDVCTVPFFFIAAGGSLDLSNGLLLHEYTTFVSGRLQDVNDREELL